MSEDAKNMLIESCDANAVVLAATSRIEKVCAGTTMIETISDSDWMDNSATSWKVEAGTDKLGLSEELDDIDKDIVDVA